MPDERRGLVRDRLAACGWKIEIAKARNVKAIATLASKPDRFPSGRLNAGVEPLGRAMSCTSPSRFGAT